MATDTQQQMEMTVQDQAGDDKSTENKDASKDDVISNDMQTNVDIPKDVHLWDDINDKKPLICMCGDPMNEIKISEFERDKYWCDVCGFQISTSSTDDISYRCSRGPELPHTGGYDICKECGKGIFNLNTDEIPNKYSINNLYFIFNNNKVSGPFTMDRVIMLYVEKTIVATQLWIKSAAAENEKWYKLQFPKDIYANKKDTNSIRFNTVYECQSLNKEIKEKFPVLYKHLIENVITGRLRQVNNPQNIPKEKRNVSVGLAVNILGNILAFSMIFIIILHNLLSICVGGCILCFVIFCYLEKASTSSILVLGIYVAYSGMIYTPVITVSLILTQDDYWFEIQSWMVAYIVWGVSSFIFTSGYWYIILHNKSSSIIDDVLWIIIGVDLGNFKLDEIWKGDGKASSILIMTFLLPSFAALMPSAIAGFIANYILEEKFQLECGDDKSNEYVCFEEKYGCCEIISSHDYRNLQEFIGGLASNIIATFGVIRVLGYLVLNAFPSFAAYVRAH